MENSLLKKLEETRELMIESGMKHGIQNPLTIRISRRLDRLMNQYDEEVFRSRNINERKYKLLQ